MTLRRSVRRAAGLLALTLLVVAAQNTTTAQRQDTGWTGTISVDVNWNGTSLPPGAPLNFHHGGHETTTYSLRGDGTASWTTQLSSKTVTSLWTIPATGSGGGHAIVDIGFDGGGWGILVDPIDTYPTQVDLTDKNTSEYENGIQSMFIKLGEQLGMPRPSPVEIEHGEHDPTGVNTPVPGAATAATLNGTTTFQTESYTYPNGDNNVPATVTVRWNLSKAPVSPHVKIYGAECGCMTNDETEKSISFTAGASPAGGTFSEFVVKSNGKMPEIGTNEGGERPRLDLTGTKDTGEITLTIVYTRNGVKTTSAPLVVNFCAIEKIQLADDEHDIAFNDFDQLRVDARARAWRSGKEVSKELEWQIEEIEAPTSVEAQPSSKKGDAIRFTYNGLPRKNSDFGRKKLTASTSGQCACQRDEYIRAFFVADAWNNPDGKTPNWFYYWKQLTHFPDGARAILRYAPVITGRNIIGTPGAQYEADVQLMFISPPILQEDGCQERRAQSPTGPPHPTTGQRAKGLDCFIEDVIHEWQHRTDAINWWGSPAGPFGVSNADTLLRDPDLDNVPNEVELEHGCSRFSSTSCPERPFDTLSDAEILAYWKGWSWKLGAAKKDDWSCGAFPQQWAGKKCGK